MGGEREKNFYIAESEGKKVLGGGKREGGPCSIFPHSLGGRKGGEPRIQSREQSTRKNHF